MIFGKNFHKTLAFFLFFLFVFQVIDIIFSLYWKAPWIDNITHFWGGGIVAMSMIWWTFYYEKVSVSAKNLPKFYSVIIILGFTALVGIFWEFYELIVNIIITKNNYTFLFQQNGLLDTLKDMFVDLAGGMAAVAYFFYERKK